MIKLIKLFYLLYTVYTIIALLISNYDLKEAFIGVILIWGVFYSLKKGYDGTHIIKSAKREISFFHDSISSWNLKKIVANSVICIVFTLASIKYYVGKNLLEVFNTLISGRSAYNEYQLYFRINNLETFSWEKLIFVFMLSYITYCLFVDVLILLSNENKKLRHYLYITLIVSLYLLFGISRGTNFEMYIVFTLFAFSVFCNGRSSYANYCKFLLMGMVVLLVFLVVVGARGADFTVYELCSEILIDESSIIYESFPEIVKIIQKTFAYFGYGVFVLGRTISNLIDDGLMSFLSITLPGGYYAYHGLPLQKYVFNTIDIGVRWVPDIIGWMNIFGFPLFIVGTMCLGRVINNVKGSCSNEKYLLIIQFIVFLLMISLPIGNFIFASTPNLIISIYFLSKIILYNICIRV